MGLTEEEESTANAASRFINILFFVSERRGFQSRQKLDFWMHSINTSVSFHSRPNSGLLFSVDNSKKLSGNYMDYLVEYSFYFFLKMARACRIRCFVFIAAPTNDQPLSVLFLNCCYVLFATITNILSMRVKTLTVSCLFCLQTNLSQ